MVTIVTITYDGTYEGQDRAIEEYRRERPEFKGRLIVVPETKESEAMEKGQVAGEPAPVKEREPWEMSKAEFERARNHSDVIKKLPNEREHRELEAYPGEPIHKIAVRKAIKEGKIPSHPDYPDLPGM